MTETVDAGRMRQFVRTDSVYAENTAVTGNQTVPMAPMNLPTVVS